MENSLNQVAGNDAITLVKDQVESFINDTQKGRAQAERCRDYFDHKHWTAAEIAKLESRNQAPVVVNRIKPKVEGLVGLYNMRKVDPKAYARTKKHEKASQAITDALRYVADDVDLNKVKTDCAGDFFVEGTCAAIVDVRQKRSGEVAIRAARIPWDRAYADPHSRDLDFEDARFKGMMLWLGADQILEMFPEADIDALGEDSYDETFEDRPRWADKGARRYRLAYHFWIKDGVWWYCIFSGNTFLVEPQESPFLDDEGEPCCIIEMVSANIDRENVRYGEVLGYLPLNDEINHRRSKALHLLSQRQTKSRKGAIKDVKALKRELAKPDGHIEVQGPAEDFEIMQTGDMAQGQFEIYMDAKAELDAVGLNAQLAGERQQGDLSGKAIDRLQQAGTLELNRQFGLLTNWEKRIYRQIWARIKQFWNEEKWIRVTDDHDNLRWVGLNSQVTTQQFLEEQINDTSLPLSDRKRYAASFQFLMSAAQAQDPNPQVMQMAEQAKAKLEEIIEVRNDVAELDVDIILDQSFDVINTEQEQFQLIAQLAQNRPDIDTIEVIEASQIRGKDKMIEKIEKRRAQAAEAAGNLAQMQSRKIEADVAKTMSEVQMNTEKAIGQKVENQLMLLAPEKVDNITV
jgi:hypothetical protein